MAIVTKEVKKPHPHAIERRELRSSHSKTFVMPDGKMRCDLKVGTPAHYRDDDGSLRSCDCTVQQDDGKVFVDWLPYKFKLHDTGIGFDFQSRESGFCSVSLVGIGGNTFDKTQKLNPIIEGDKITFSEVVPGLDIVFCILPARVKSWRIVKDATAPRTFEWLCEHDKDGREKISDKLIGKDAAKNDLELISEAIAIDDKSFSFIETWTGNVKLRDKKTRIKSLSEVVSYPVLIDPTVDYNITANGDNGFEYSGNFGNSFYVKIGSGPGSSSWSGGFRFRSIIVPQGATITSATLTVNVTSNYNGGAIALLYGYDTDNSVIWSSYGSPRPSNVAKTSASANIVQGSTGSRSFDVTSIIQEIVNRGGWASGNNLSLLTIDNNPISYQYTYIEDLSNAGTNEASLSITYSVGASAALSGTITSATTEADIVAGGKTIILTLTGDTWIAAGAGSFDLQRQNIINGITSAQSETFGWNLVPKALQGVAGVVRTSDTQVTITLDAQATYNITATETITVTIPSTALTGGNAIVATPTFTVSPVSSINLVKIHRGTRGFIRGMRSN